MTWMSTTGVESQVPHISKNAHTKGYVRVEEDGRTLILPDYSGNLFYTTLGSIESDRNSQSIVSADI
jgi:HKD family nuclease